MTGDKTEIIAIGSHKSHLHAHTQAWVFWGHYIVQYVPVESHPPAIHRPMPVPSASTMLRRPVRCITSRVIPVGNIFAGTSYGEWPRLPLSSPRQEALRFFRGTSTEYRHPDFEIPVLPVCGFRAVDSAVFPRGHVQSMRNRFPNTQQLPTLCYHGAPRSREITPTSYVLPKAPTECIFPADAPLLQDEKCSPAK
jgi:hypothetical protein